MLASGQVEVVRKLFTDIVKTSQKPNTQQACKERSTHIQTLSYINAIVYIKLSHVKYSSVMNLQRYSYNLFRENWKTGKMVEIRIIEEINEKIEHILTMLNLITSINHSCNFSLKALTSISDIN